jgi:predicted CoA-binding protein
MVKNVLGETAYASPEDVPVKIDLVDVFRAPKHADAVVDSWIKLRVPAIWFQEGVINESAARRASWTAVPIKTTCTCLRVAHIRTRVLLSGLGFQPLFCHPPLSAPGNKASP